MVKRALIHRARGDAARRPVMAAVVLLLAIATSDGALAEDANALRFRQGVEASTLEPETIPEGQAIYLGYTSTAPNFHPETYPECWDPYHEKRQAMADAYPGVDFFLGAGTVSAVGGGFFEDRARTGWTIRGGARAPITSPHRPTVLFGEIGGAYMHNDGGGDPQITSGIFTDGATGQSFELADFRETHLRSLRRGSIHTAIGASMTPQGPANRGWKKLQFNTRFGIRLGHLDARYQQDPTAALQTLINQQVALGSNPATFRFSDRVERSDTFFGLFTSMGVGVTYDNVSWGFARFRRLSFSAEIEYSHEWFDLGEYGIGDRGLNTLVPTLNASWAY